jgi:hypothetical protein
MFPASRPEEVNQEFDAEQKRDDQNGQHEPIRQTVG